MIPDRLLALGIVAILVAVTALAIKSRFLNQRIIALAKQFRLHHLLSLIAGAGMITHVALAFWRDWPDSLGLYFTLSDLPTLASWLSLFCFAVVIASSWLPRLPWKHWYLLHLLVIPAFALAALHAFIAAKTRPIDFGLIIIFFGAILLILLRAIFDRLSGAHAEKYSVERLDQAAEGIYELHLERLTGTRKEPYPAGSIVYLRFLSTGFSRAWHPFSVASCRYENNLRLLIKGIGADTTHLDALRTSDTVLVRGPYREFTPDFSRPQIWIAGGIGIAPFAGYAACLAHYPHGRVTLFHFFEREAQRVALKTYAGAMSAELNEVGVPTPPHALPDLGQVLSAARDVAGVQFIVCGPPAFMRYVRRALKRAGIVSGNIETEEFLPW